MKSAMIGCTAIVAAALLVGAGTATAAPHVYGPFQIRNLHSGKCLEIPDGRKENGVHAQQWDCVKDAGTQWWWEDVLSSGDGGQIVRLINMNSGKCLEVADSRTDNGAPVQQWECAGVTTQNWGMSNTCIECTDPAVHITNANSYKDLEVENSYTYNGARVQQWDYAAAPGQFWYVRLGGRS